MEDSGLGERVGIRTIRPEVEPMAGDIVKMSDRTYVRLKSGELRRVTPEILAGMKRIQNEQRQTD